MSSPVAEPPFHLFLACIVAVSWDVMCTLLDETQQEETQQEGVAATTCP